MIMKSLDIDTVVIIISVGLLLFVWMPALVLAVRKVMKQEQMDDEQ